MTPNAAQLTTTVDQNKAWLDEFFSKAPFSVLCMVNKHLNERFLPPLDDLDRVIYNIAWNRIAEELLKARD